MKLSDDLQISLTVAVSEAGRLGHEYAGLEHLLYALTFDDETAEVLKHAGADIDQRARDPHRVPLRGARESTATDEATQPRLTLGVQRVLSMAAAARRTAPARDEIDGAGRPGRHVRRGRLLCRPGAGERGGDAGSTS